MASTETRMRNLVKFEGLSEKAAREAIAASDKRRGAFMRDLRRRLGHKPSEYDGVPEYDLVINTDRLGVPDAARIVLDAASEVFGLQVETATASRPPLAATN